MSKIKLLSMEESGLKFNESVAAIITKDLGSDAAIKELGVINKQVGIIINKLGELVDITGATNIFTIWLSGICKGELDVEFSEELLSKIPVSKRDELNEIERQLKEVIRTMVSTVSAVRTYDKGEKKDE